VYAVFERTREPSAAVEAAASVFAELARARTVNAAAPTLPEHVYRQVWQRLKDEPAASGRPSVPASRLAESVGARTALIRGAVARLGPQERALFLFTRIAGVPVGDAARIVGVSEIEARRLLVKALDSLRGTLGSLLELMSEGRGA
jgi:DNA-directed RNA polymerase specialized sigma24 family protein